MTSTLTSAADRLEAPDEAAPDDLSASSPHPTEPTARLLLDGPRHLVAPLARALTDLGHETAGGPHAVDRLELALRSPEPPVPPDALVLVATPLLRPGRGRVVHALQLPHLPVIHEPWSIQVGPLVVPGTPCLRCLDLHRADRDPDWTARLARPADLTAQPDAEAVSLVSAVVSRLTRRLVAGRRHLPGVSFDVDVAAPALTPRQWTHHPRCPCRRGQ